MARILVVEDDPFLSRAYDTILQKEGFEVELAQDGVRGLEKAQDAEFDLILLDMLTPELGALEFLRAYDRLNKHPRTHFIVFSNGGDPDAMKEARDLGAEQFLVKAAISPKEMVGIIQKALAAPQ